MRFLLFICGLWLVIKICSTSPHEKIDCHSHFIPPGYRTALQESGQGDPDGFPIIPSWSEDAHLDLMSSINVSKAMLSISTPGTHLVPGDDALARNLSAYCNDYASDLKKNKPDKFGFFASLPLPDVEGTLCEISRAFDDLNADGVAMMTNHHGYYLGDSKFDKVFEELNRRKAIIFIHPTTPFMLDSNHMPVAAVPLPQYPRPMFEFFFDTARAVINLFLSGTVTRSPNITFMIAHMGGAFPPMMRRFASTAGILNLTVDSNITPEWVEERLNAQFYFDSAGWPFPEQAESLLNYITVDRMVYGTDYCFTAASIAQNLSAEADKYLPQIFPDPQDVYKLCTGNAQQLFSR